MSAHPASDGPPVACTLAADDMPARVAGWSTLLEQARARIATADGGLRVEFDETVAVDQLALLAAAEQRCCAFFSFAVTVDDRGVGLEVRAPDGADDVVAALFGTAD